MVGQVFRESYLVYITIGFNPRAPRGATCFCAPNPSRSRGFNPRAPAGRHSKRTLGPPHPCGFNPRAPAGRDRPTAAFRR